MATLLMQTSDVGSNEKFAFSPLANARFQAEAVSRISHDEAARQKAEQVGRSRSRKGKNGQKKLPQRGLGVAQLEKLRLQEQCRQEAACLASIRAQVLPFSSTSPFGEHGSTFCLHYPFGHHYKGDTLQDNGHHPETSVAATLENLKPIHPENYGSGLISNSVADHHNYKVKMTQGVVIDCEALNRKPSLHRSYSDPLNHDKKSIVSALPVVLTKPENGDSDASCVSRVQDSSNTSLSVSVGDPRVANVKAVHKDLFLDGGKEVCASSRSPNVDIKSISDGAFGNNFTNQIRFMKNRTLALAETEPAIKLEPRSRDPTYQSISFHSSSYTSGSNFKQESHGVKDDGSSDKGSLPSTRTNVELFATLGPPGALHPQVSHSDISSVIFSSFGERPKELSSFQKFLGTQVWSSIEKASVKKRKWCAVQDPSNHVYSADMDHSTAVVESEHMLQENTKSRVHSASNYKMGAFCRSGSGRKTKSPLTEADAKSMPAWPENQNLLSLDNKRSTYLENFSSAKSYVAQPIIYNALLGISSFDHKKKDCSSMELLPIQLRHQAPIDALTLQLSSPQYSAHAELETKEIFAEKSDSNCSDNHSSSHIQASDGDCVIQCKTFTSAQADKVYQMFPKNERPDVEVSTEQRSLMAGSQTRLSYEGFTKQDTGQNAGPDGSPLDLSLKLAL
ncbi:hypothetical protein O6H91_13G054300 [Diphasiastrum complanatum]|uniref:Uncharacterized protein n=1 Tax=Diphasiastrum complanatum TaxID=34168 RepID=A0ACC2BUU1_DIPCM|nr:hypothetical protein O6H91_13G054300 [Diphasiastrum complanatum]